MEQIVEQQSTGKGKKVLLIGLSLATTGIVGYFGYQWWKNRKATTDQELPELDLTPPDSTSFTLPTASMRNDDFPLKKGSKGARVKQLQQALIDKHGKLVLPKYGADGDFGSEMVAALSKQNYPASIDASTFNVIVQATGINANATAAELYTAAAKKDFPTAIKSLQKLKSKEDYTSVSEIFKNNYRISGVRQTLVNGILGSFQNEQQKQAIRLQFTRMGLNYDGSKWSLSGLDTSGIITTQATIVWEHSRKAIKVPANMVLGKEVIQKEKYTLFENNGKHFLVETKNIARIA